VIGLLGGDDSSSTLALAAAADFDIDGRGSTADVST
jgi:hypothetical protein